jgi:hypothetical protein
MFDDLIEQAARKLTAGSPAQDFRARVLNRIEGNHGRSSIVAWTAVAAAAAVAIVAGVVTLRNTRHASIPSAPIVIVPPAPLAPLASLASSEPPRVEGSEPPRVEGSERSESRGAAPALPALETARTESPVLPPGFEPIAPESIAIASLEIVGLDPPAPATVPALSIASIDIPSLDASPTGQH